MPSMPSSSIDVLVDRRRSGLTRPSSPLTNTRSKSGANEPCRSQPVKSGPAFESSARRVPPAASACSTPQGARVDREPAAVVDRPELVHVDRDSSRRPMSRATVRPVLGDRRSCRGRGPRGGPSTRSRTARRRRRRWSTSGRAVGGVGCVRDHLAVVEDDDARREADRGEGCRRHPPQPIVGAWTRAWREWTADDAAEWIVRARSPTTTSTRAVCSGWSPGRTSTRAPRCSASRPPIAPGVGMVRYIGPRAVRSAVLARRPETVTVARSGAGAGSIGSGIDPRRRSFVLLGDLQRALAARVPVVLDAGALDLVGTHTAPTVITPHARELARLLISREVDASPSTTCAPIPATWAAASRAGTRRRGAAQGRRDPRLDPDGDRLRRDRSPPTGSRPPAAVDVLGGILGALVATHHEALATTPTCSPRSPRPRRGCTARRRGVPATRRAVVRSSRSTSPRPFPA